MAQMRVTQFFKRKKTSNKTNTDFNRRLFCIVKKGPLIFDDEVIYLDV